MMTIVMEGSDVYGVENTDAEGAQPCLSCNPSSARMLWMLDLLLTSRALFYLAGGVP